MSDLIEDFRQNIRKLRPDGEEGFEGLMAAVLSGLTKRSFALASAGSQHGKDGQSALDGGTVVFEAKRYDDTVPKDKIHTKILEIAADNASTTELYILAAISKRDATASLALFERLKTSSPNVRVTFGRDKIGLDSVTAWGAADHTEMKELLFARLDRIGNDHDLAMEVLAAIRAERIDVLRDYVVDRRQRAEPAHRARATMVAGLSPDEIWAVESVEMLKDEHGFLQRAYSGAKYAMERHQWSRHWTGQMRIATDPVDLWRYAILLSKIVDGRFEAFSAEGDSPSPLIERFGTTLNDPIRNRIGRWKNKRESKLFGMNVPDRTFLPGDQRVKRGGAE